MKGKLIAETRGSLYSLHLTTTARQPSDSGLTAGMGRCFTSPIASAKQTEGHFMSDAIAPHTGGTSQIETIGYVPIPGQREAATERRKQFPYRFPRDPRWLGGKFTVAENARRLLRYF